MRERVIGPPSDVAASGHACAAHGCPLPPGCGACCFVHDGLAAKHWPEATAAVQRFGPLFDLAVRMSNASPGDALPAATRQAIAQRCGDLEFARTVTARQAAASLRSWLSRHCRPRQDERASAANRMHVDGLRPVADLIPTEAA